MSSFGEFKFCTFVLQLQRVDPTVTIPYWNWAKDNSFSSAGFRHIWTDQFMGGNVSRSFVVSSWCMSFVVVSVSIIVFLPFYVSFG